MSTLKDWYPWQGQSPCANYLVSKTAFLCYIFMHILCQQMKSAKDKAGMISEKKVKILTCSGPFISYHLLIIVDFYETGDQSTGTRLTCVVQSFHAENANSLHFLVVFKKYIRLWLLVKDWILCHHIYSNHSNIKIRMILLN